MPFIKMKTEGYKCCFSDNSPAFETKQYEDMWQFIYADMQPLQTLCKDFLNCIVNIDTLEEKAAVPSAALDAVYSEIKYELKKVHPLYEMYPYYASNLLADYFNDLLSVPLTATAQFVAHYSGEYLDNARQIIKDIDLYNGILTKITSVEPYSPECDIRIFEDYSRTLKTQRLKLDKLLNDTAGNGFAVATPMAELLYAQRIIKQSLYWILDKDNPNTKGMSLPQRLVLFDRLSLNPAMPSMIRNIKRIYGYEPRYEIYDSILHGVDFDLPFDSCTPVDDKKMAALQKIKADIGTSKNCTTSTYCANYILDIMMLEFDQMVQNEVSLRKCKHCGRYFVCTDSKVLYCSRTSVGETQPCSIIGKRETFKSLVKEDAILSVYTNARHTKHSQLQRGKIDALQYEEWFVAANKLFDKARAGKVSLEVFTDNITAITRLRPKKATR